MRGYGCRNTLESDRVNVCLRPFLNETVRRTPRTAAESISTAATPINSRLPRRYEILSAATRTRHKPEHPGHPQLNSSARAAISVIPNNYLLATTQPSMRARS